MPFLGSLSADSSQGARILPDPARYCEHRSADMLCSVGLVQFDEIARRVADRRPLSRAWNMRPTLRRHAGAIQPGDCIVQVVDDEREMLALWGHMIFKLSDVQFLSLSDGVPRAWDRKVRPR
jgi:hypothetical protein